ncbi:MAG TPA: hypothetical protein VK483_01965 [Chitinophagaceae bacterium]|nr:hypothetical protein [Chitinophagaceae bacterium]
MKRNHPQSLYNADNLPKATNERSSAPTEQNKTPYLRAILAGTTKLFASGNDSAVINPDREAALRYIKESTFMKKFYLGKMSC